MTRNRVQRLIEDLLPWWDRLEEARHDERSRYIHQRSIFIRQQVERDMAQLGAERIRAAYLAASERLDRR